MHRFARIRFAAILLGLLIGILPVAAQPVRLVANLVSEGLDLPLGATAPPGDSRLFVVEQTGRIRIVADGRVLETPFLDLRDSVSVGSERGLLGLAFHPDYATNGRFFVDYTDAEGDTRIVAYTVSSDPNVADPASAELVLGVDQPYANHNGGWLGFGPDGLLYIGMGDGGGGGDPDGRAQDPDQLLGKILRLDVDAARPYGIPADNPFADGGGRPEIFALGVRNPWRIDFDGDDIYIADVGQSAWEEVTVITTSDGGANLGWNRMEGPDCFRASSCDRTGTIPATYAYSHDTGGCSIIGGHVYRGRTIPELDGLYVFADLCIGVLESFAYADGKAGEVTDWGEQLGSLGAVTSLGEDAAGELYVTTIEGNLYRIDRAP